MKLKKFLSYFLRVQSPDPDAMTIRFVDGRGNDGPPLRVTSVEFSVEDNAWTVRLAGTLTP